MLDLNKYGILPQHYLSVKFTCDKLTNEELSVLYMTILFDGNPHDKLFKYKDVEPLFTEDHGLKMHSDTKIIVAHLSEERYKVK